MGEADLRREITVEQQYVDDDYALLDAMRIRSAESLEQVRRAPVVPTPAGRAERDAFDALHTDRLAQLQAVEDRLVFGRLDLADGHTRHVGRIGLSDDEQRQLLLDWRAPAAAAFYQATAAEPLGLLRRRHIALSGRLVTGIDDEVLDADALAAAAAAGRGDLATVTGEGALMSALTAHRTGRMRDIVATLQAEQDAIVRAELPGVLVVQGGPGTGKTAVALHRAAYLLYTHRDRIARSGVLVVGPSPVFLRYIEQVLPALGETGVVLSTLGQLVPGLDATAHDRGEVAVLKGDLRMATLVRAAVRRRQRLLTEPIRIDVDGDPVVLRPEVVAAARGRARQSGRPHNETRVTFVRHVLDDLADQLAERRRLQQLEDERPDLIEELRTVTAVRREVNLLWMPLTAAGLVRDLLTKPARLAEAAGGLLSPAQQRSLLRERHAPWTVEDVPLIDEAAELIGPDVATFDPGVSARAARDRAESLEFARRVLAESGEAAAMMTAEMLADRYAGGRSSRSVAERAAEDRSWTYGHAVVDEAQELSAMQWRLLARRVPNRSMTVVGDIAQTGSAAGAHSWQQSLEPIVGQRLRVAALTVNYRTPARVMALATDLLASGPDGAADAAVRANAPRSAREGDWDPIGYEVPGRDARSVPEEAADAVVAALLADEAALHGGRYAVVTPRAALAAVAGPVAKKLLDVDLARSSSPANPDDEALAPRVEVMHVDDVKGLEFDAVVVVDPMAILRESPRGVNDLYVALTRPTQRLSVVHHGRLPRGLAGLAAAQAPVP